jgi:Ca2+-binding RTX toxin-like protein
MLDGTPSLLNSELLLGAQSAPRRTCLLTVTVCEPAAAMLARASTSGDDTIVGFNTADTIRGGAGNDRMNGGQGDDTYIYARRDGNDTIIEDADSGHSDFDTLRFENINSSAISLVRNGIDVTLVVAESAPGAGDGGSVLLKNELDDYYSRAVEKVVFADGTAWTH